MAVTLKRWYATEDIHVPLWAIIRTKGTLPVSPHLRPKPTMSATLPDHLNCVVLIEQIDRSSHYLGWGYDYTECVPMDVARGVIAVGEA